MLTVICKLTFKDGATASGTICAESPQGTNPIMFEGELDRLPERSPETNASGLKLMFAEFARELDAELSVEETGEYDVWAE